MNVVINTNVFSEIVSQDSHTAVRHVNTTLLRPSAKYTKGGQI